MPEGTIGKIVAWYWWYLKIVINWRCLLGAPVQFFIELVAVAFSAIAGCVWIIVWGAVLPIFLILFFYYLLVEIIKEIIIILRKFWFLLIPFELVLLALTYVAKTIAFLFCGGDRPWGIEVNNEQLPPPP